MEKLTTLGHLQAAAGKAMGFASEVAAAASAAIREVHKLKADKPLGVVFSLPASGWEEDAAAEAYPMYYDFAITGVTAKDRASVVLAPASQATAIACGLCPTNETIAGKIRFRADTAPAEAISAVYYLDKGRSE